MHHTWVTKDPVMDEEKQNASHLGYQGSSAGWRETDCTKDPVLAEEKQNASHLGYQGSSAG